MDSSLVLEVLEAFEDTGRSIPSLVEVRWRGGGGGGALEAIDARLLGASILETEGVLPGFRVEDIRAGGGAGGNELLEVARSLSADVDVTGDGRDGRCLDSDPEFRDGGGAGGLLVVGVFIMGLIFIVLDSSSILGDNLPESF